MKLLFISQLFDPEYSIKGLEFLQEISRAGFEVDVITSFPNYPTGKIYPGYKNRLRQIEQHGAIRVVRVYSYISHSRSKISRALTYLSFMLAALIAALVMRRPDVIYAYHPQITTGILSWLVRLVRKTPFITDVQDLWPDALVATGAVKHGLLYGIIDKLCSFIYRKSDHVVVLSRGYMDALVQRGVPAEKISVVYNWNSGEGQDAKAEAGEDPFPMANRYDYKFVYAGNLGSAQSLKSVIAAFARVEHASVCLLVIGSGVEKDELAGFAKSVHGNNIYFLGYIPASQIKKYLSAADVLVVHLKDDPLFKITIPSKLQAYMNAGKPILMAVGGEANSIVEAAGAGVCALPDNIDSIAAAVLAMLERKDGWGEMGANGKRYYRLNLSQRLAVEKIAGLLRQVAQKE